jgi:hypothetical protein
MLKGNNVILNKICCGDNHDLARAFCLSTVFIQISSKIETHSCPGEPDVKILEDAHELFVKFVKCEFKDCVLV